MSLLGRKTYTVSIVDSSNYILHFLSLFSGASSNNARVKQEPPDEAEIRELAAKISEANKAKMAQAQANQNARAANAANLANGQGIASYFPKVTPQNKLAATQPTAAVEAPVTPAKKTENVPIDESSRKGILTEYKFYLNLKFKVCTISLNKEVNFFLL